MKNINTIINGVLVIAVIALFVMYTNLKSSVAPLVEVPEVIEDSVEVENESIDSILSKRVLDFPIAFVNMDSVVLNFKYIQQQGDKLEKSVKHKTGWFQREEVRIAKEYETFAKSIYEGTTTLTTQEQVQAKEMDFQKRQQTLLQNKAKFEQSIMKQQAELSIETNKSLREFLKKYKEDLNYSYVFPSGSNGALLYANDSLDITTEVIKALNTEYASKIK